MRSVGNLVRCAVVVVMTLNLGGCQSNKYAEGERQLKMPINCATAEGDIRLLEHEKAHVADQVAAGVTAVAPAGAIVGLVTGTEGEKIKVGTGEYNRMIDRRIAEIKAECGLD